MQRPMEVSASSHDASVPVRVAVLDDHAVVREGLARIIDGVDGLALVCSGRSIQAIEAALAAQPADVCIVDLRLPDGEGVEVLHRLRVSHPDLGLLVFTIMEPHVMAARCIHAGASGFLTKGASPAEVVEAVLAVHRRQLRVPTEIIRQLVQRPDGADDPHHRLSDREFEVFIRLARGRTTGEISTDLHLDQRTVTSYRRRALDKLGLSRNAELVEYALRHGLLD